MLKVLFYFLQIFIFFVSLKPTGAQSIKVEPQIPCKDDISTNLYKANRPFSVRVWKREQIPNWVPPHCLGWKPAKFDFLIYSVGRFNGVDDIRTVSQRVIAFSKLKNIVYWSVTNNEWRFLFDDAATLSNSNTNLRRKDFTAKNVQSGAVFYYVQDENTILGPVIFRMTIRERSKNSLVFSSVNISPFRVAFLNAVEPGRFEQYYMIRRESADTWLYFSLVRSKMNYTFLTPSRLSSFNRAAAYFHHVAGISYKKNQFTPNNENE